MRRALLPALLLTALAVAPAASGLQAPESELARLQAEFRDETARARRLRADADAARDELARLESRLASLRAEAATGDGRIEVQRARLAQLSRQEAALVADMARERGAQTRLLSALQMMSRRPPPPLPLPADKAVDPVRAAILPQSTTPALHATAATLKPREAQPMPVRPRPVPPARGPPSTQAGRADAAVCAAA